jgi:hypothetical protein
VQTGRVNTLLITRDPFSTPRIHLLKKLRKIESKEITEIDLCPQNIKLLTSSLGKPILNHVVVLLNVLSVIKFKVNRGFIR